MILPQLPPRRRRRWLSCPNLPRQCCEWTWWTRRCEKKNSLPDSVSKNDEWNCGQTVKYAIIPSAKPPSKLTPLTRVNPDFKQCPAMFSCLKIRIWARNFWVTWRYVSYDQDRPKDVQEPKAAHWRGHLRLTITIWYWTNCNGQRIQFWIRWAYLAFARSLTHCVCVSSFPSSYLGRLFFWSMICVFVCVYDMVIQVSNRISPCYLEKILSKHVSWRFSGNDFPREHEWSSTNDSKFRQLVVVCTHSELRLCFSQYWIPLQPIRDSSGSACVHAPWRIWRTYFMGLQSLPMRLAIFCT